MSREISFRSLVVQADPEHSKNSENPTEYEFTGAKGKGMRLFKGRYRSRGPYATQAATDNGLQWNGRQITFGGIPLTWDEGGE